MRASAASGRSGEGNSAVQSAMGFPTAAALIEASRDRHSVRASMVARLPPISSPQTPILVVVEEG